jgi:hypothetical protein
MILLQNLHACFYACPFVLICNLLWHAPSTNFMMPKALVDDGICRFTIQCQGQECVVLYLHSPIHLHGTVLS